MRHAAAVLRVMLCCLAVFSLPSFAESLADTIGVSAAGSDPDRAERLKKLAALFPDKSKSIPQLKPADMFPNARGYEDAPILTPEHWEAFAILDPQLDVPRREQPFLYRFCHALFVKREYAQIEPCLDRLDQSVARHGEWPLLVFKEKKYLLISPYPLGVESPYLRGQLALELGDAKGAAGYFQLAKARWDRQFATWVAEGWGAELVGWGGMGELNKIQHYRIAMYQAVALFQSGDIEKSREVSKIVEETDLAFSAIGEKKNKSSHLANLVQLHMSTGRMDSALALVEGKSTSFAGSRVVEGFLGTVVTGLVAGGPLGAIVYPVVFGPMVILRDPVGLAAKFRFATLLASNDRFAEAQPELDQLLDDPVFQASASLYWSALYDRGRVAENEGNAEGAIGYYRRAIEQIEAQRSTINSEGARIGFFGDRQNPYRALTRLLIRQGKHEDAFLVTERSKARALVDMLANKQDLLDASTPSREAEELLAQQRALDGVMLTGERPSAKLAGKLPLLASASEKTDPRAVVQQIRSVQAETVKAIDRASPELASLVAVTDIDLGEIRARLPKDETLVSYFYDQNDLYAFLVSGTQVQVEKLDRAGLEKDVEDFRKALQEPGSGYQPFARKLHERIVRPWITKVSTSKLIIAPHGVLHYLPFNALADETGFLIDRHQLSFVPSASALRFIGKTKADGKAGAMLALGNPDLGSPQYDLAFAGKEARSVTALFPGSATLLRKEASKENFKKYGAGFKYLHFATHGEFDGDDPMGSALMLAGNSITDEKDRLTVGELYSMRLNADLVTLSACQTGLGKVSNGDDVVGLVRGFLYAGANSVISTLWEIDDEATEKLMLDFYRDMKAGKPKASALRNAQLQLRKRYPEPRYWAAFQITGGSTGGDPRGR